MKTSRVFLMRKSSLRGFTLIELLVVMSIIALLAALTVGAFGYAQQSASRNRTVAAHAAIKAALEQYKEKFGEYPEAKNPTQMGDASGGSFRTGGAMMLYQSISGDGTDQINLPSAGSSSDGKIDKDVDLPNVINGNLPKAMILRTAAGYMLVDGFGRPFQYSKAPDANTVNPTYDLWSFANIERSSDAAVKYDLASKKDANITAKWIKNW